VAGAATERGGYMAIEYTVGEAIYEVEVPGAPMVGLPQDIFYYRSLVRRKKVGNQPETDYKTIMDVGGKHPYISTSDKLALQNAKDWLDNNGETLH
jgi:hypothetical protein